MRGALMILCLGLGAGVASAAGEPTPAERMFERLKGLAGEWEGTYEWSEGRTGGGPLKVTYAITGAGSAVMETLIQGGTPTMTTVYHVDGADLRMTHYCGARNQPRLKSSKIDAAAGTAEFSFVDMTPSASSPVGHVQGFVIRIPDEKNLSLRFIFGGGKGAGVENITLHRSGG